MRVIMKLLTVKGSIHQLEVTENMEKGMKDMKVTQQEGMVTGAMGMVATLITIQKKSVIYSK